MNYDKAMSWTYGTPQEISEIERIKTAYTKHNILREIVKHFPSDTPLRVLEFGPGLGVMLNLLRQQYPNLSYVAVDFDPSVLERMKTIYPSSQTFLAGTYESAKQVLSGKIFDVIIGLDVWEHLPNVVLYTKLSYELLAKGGVIILQMPNLGAPAGITAYSSDITHQNLFNERSLKQVCLMAEIPIEEIVFKPYEFPPLNLFWRLRSFLRKCFFIGWNLYLLLLGIARCRILTPNILCIIYKGL